MLTIDRLNELLSYDRSSGSFIWRVTVSQGIAGQTLGSVAGGGYLTTKIDKRNYRVHTLVWFIENKRMPLGELDHIDGNKLNNRIENLREVSHQENMRNACRSRANTSGRTGVAFRKDSNKWRAYIGVNGRLVHCGSYTTKDEAIAARKAAERRFGFHENHGKERPQ